MRARLVRTCLAATLAVAVALPVAAQPAQADEGDNGAIYELILDLVSSLLSKSESGLSKTEIAQLVLELVTAINSHEADIISHIDRIEAADLRGEATGILLVSENLNSMTGTALQNHAASATVTAKKAQSQIKAVESKAAADDLGYSMHTLYNIAIVANAKANWNWKSVRDHYYIANDELIRKLAPTCANEQVVQGPGQIYEVYHCQAYDGRTAQDAQWYTNGKWHVLRNGEWVEGQVNQVEVQNQATAHTSRAIAIAVLRERDAAQP
ncbi:hypothetical protein K1W54_14265 [Micromonospora sp. CPCC 205371]|nr:hypothetical protein [Micromonospora sp. CPCC 205371]